MKFCPQGFQVHIFGICGAPCGSSSKYFSRPIPQHGLNICSQMIGQIVNELWTFTC